MYPVKVIAAICRHWIERHAMNDEIKQIETQQVEVPAAVEPPSETHTLLAEIEVELKKLDHEPVVLWAKFKALRSIL